MTLGSKTGVIRIAVVKGQAPLLISRVALKTFQGVLDFARQELRVFKEQDDSTADQFSGSDQGSFEEIMMSEEAESMSVTSESSSLNVSLRLASSRPIRPALLWRTSRNAHQDLSYSVGHEKIRSSEQCPRLANRVHIGIWSSVELYQIWRPMKPFLMK